MKIKTKKEMTQEEYAKYLIDKYGVSGFESVLLDDNIIDAPTRFKQSFELNPILKKDLLVGSFRNGKFTVEVEEEITEDTVLPKLVTKNINGGYNGWTDRSIDSFIIGYMEAIYIPNDDLTMTLIWRDGKLVE